MNERLGQVGKFVKDATGVSLLADTLRKTAHEEWPTMGRRARLGAIAAAALTLYRPVREVVKLGRKDENRNWWDTAGDGVSAATDGLDGLIARRTGGQTAAGGVGDQLIGDKTQRWIKDASMAERGRISWIHPAVRFGRDLAVTWYREKTVRDMAGRVSVDATPKNDPWSGKYSTLDYLITNTLIDSPLGAKMPRWTRETLATMTDVHIVATGVANIVRLRRMSQASIPGGEPEPESDVEDQEAA